MTIKKHQTNSAEANVVHIRKISTGVAMIVPSSIMKISCTDNISNQVMLSNHD